MAKTDNTNPRSYKRTVDWGAIGKQFTDAIVDTKTQETETAKKGFEAQKERAKVKRERAERKEVFEDEAVEFEKLQRDNQRAIQTNTPSRNAVTLGVTEQGVVKYNELFQGFKSGKMSEREFLRSRQNLKDGFTNYFRIAKEYNDMKANADKSIAEGGSKTITDFMLGQLESLQNTENLDVSFTDKGQWNVSYLDGVTQTKQEMPIETFGVIGRVNYSGFDEETAAKEIDDTIGTFTNQYGNVTKIDPRDRPDYENLIDKKLNVALGNAGQLASYLLDNIDVDENGEPFELTLDPKVAATNKNYILVTINNNDGVPTFQVSDEAKEYAKQKLKEQVEGRFDISKKVTRNTGGGSSRGRSGSGSSSTVKFEVNQTDKDNLNELQSIKANVDSIKEEGGGMIAISLVNKGMTDNDMYRVNQILTDTKNNRSAVVRYLASIGELPTGTELIQRNEDGGFSVNEDALKKADDYIQKLNTGTITPSKSSETETGTGSKYNIKKP
jgi:hypothetical protein